MDIIARVYPSLDARILEIGCGDGANGTHVKAVGKAGYFAGIELDPVAAAKARRMLDLVFEGNVEQLDLAGLGGPFDAVIISEVLEHLLDPWSVIDRINSVMTPEGRIFASSPNLSIFQVIQNLVRGDFDYTDAGIMDRTNLRWFTPLTFTRMF